MTEVTVYEPTSLVVRRCLAFSLNSRSTKKNAMTDADWARGGKGVAKATTGKKKELKKILVYLYCTTRRTDDTKNFGGDYNRRRRR